jgi:polyphosphate kinase 2
MTTMTPTPSINEQLYDLDVDELAPEIAAKAFSSGDYPHAEKLNRKIYERELRALQIELLKVADWARQTEQRLVLVFEGRDAAGKGGTIKRYMAYLNPRQVRVVALPKPSDAERGQWYFQRYVPHLPTAGEWALFDRSWYNRAGVERVMGFCTEPQVEAFFRQVPDFERLLVRDGVRLFKFWLTIGREEQLRRLHDRKSDPLRRWKLSGIDFAAPKKWHDYTAAKNDMFKHTHTRDAPWTVIKANDKRRARLNCMRVLLTALDYPEKDANAIGVIDDAIVGTGLDEMD